MKYFKSYCKSRYFIEYIILLIKSYHKIHFLFENVIFFKLYLTI